MPTWTLTDEDIANIETRAQATLAHDGPIGALRLGHVQALIRDLRALHKLRARLAADTRAHLDLLQADGRNHP